MAEIDVQSAEEPSRFLVRVTEKGSSSEHEVTATDADLRDLAAGYRSAEHFIRACFEFLLAREPKEQILRHFDVGVISRYFPEFEEEIRRRP